MAEVPTGSGPGIASCSGSASNGTPIATSTLGADSFRVTTASLDGQSATRTVSYSVVLPSNRLLTLSRLKLLSHGDVFVTVKVPAPGTVDVRITAPTGGPASGIDCFSRGVDRSCSVERTRSRGRR